MTNKLLPLKAIIVSLLMATFLACSSDDDEPLIENPIEEQEESEVIDFPDDILKREVKLVLGLSEEDEITQENILALEELTIEGLDASEMTDLTGLEYAENLTYLRFGETGVTDLSPIADLENITYLRFNDTGVTDLSPIANYTNLTYFNINTAGGITDISPLAGNTGLQEIILRDVPFGDEGMATLANFTSLYRINMRGTGVTDLTVLGSLMAAGALLDSTPGAEENGGADLDLRGLTITDWRPIAAYVDQITTMEGAPENEIITIPDTRLATQIKIALEIPEETVLTNLYMLSLSELNLDGADDLSENGDIRDISDLTGLEYAENITYLRFGETAVTDISPIANLENLEYLRFNDTGVTDLSPLSNYTSLTYFNINSTTGVTDISPLAGNTGIKEIILREVPFGDAGMVTIGNFTNMYRINMRSTGVTDITVLGELMAQGALLDSTSGAEENGGADLDLRGLEIEDWSPIDPYLDQISNIEGN